MHAIALRLQLQLSILHGGDKTPLFLAYHNTVKRLHCYPEAVAGGGLQRNGLVEISLFLTLLELSRFAASPAASLAAR